MMPRRRDGYVAAQGCILEYRPHAGELLADGRPNVERGNTGPGLVVHYAEVGDLDAAFEHLQRALDARDPALVRERHNGTVCAGIRGSTSASHG